MKAVVGVDGGCNCKPAIKLLGRLKFEHPQTCLAHFVNPIPGFITSEAPNAPEMQEEYQTIMHNVGRDALQLAKDDACQLDLHPTCRLRSGSPADGLSRLAEETHSDLVAIQAHPGSLWATSFLGSVGRSLAIGCHSSILISKGDVKDAGPVKVVLATDHSARSRQWIEKFLSWHPHGISEITVVTAYEVSAHEARILEANLPALDGMVGGWIEEHLQGLNKRVVEQLTAAGYKATSRVCAGKANDIIRQTVQDSQADLLVMGAQGHGFFDRLLIGSCSMHQIVAEPYPVLVVRD